MPAVPPVVAHYRDAVHALSQPGSADRHVAMNTATTALAALAAAGVAAVVWQAEHHGDPASIRALIQIADIALDRGPTPVVTA